MFGNISSDVNRDFNFDWNNRLRSVTKNSEVTSYAYDDNGIRIKKLSSVGQTIFIDQYSEIRGSSIVRNIFLADKSIASLESGVLTFNHWDHIGSSNVRTNSIGDVVKGIEYLPFGQKRVETGFYNSIKSRFTSQYEDDESGLYYYQKRYYDPVLSRFISADPLYSEEMDSKGTDSQKLNLYAYAKNNPVKYTDPTGLEPPENIVPFDVAKNIEEAKNMTIGEFIDAVKTGGQWDYKQYGPQYQDLGNYNFGLVGKEVIPSEGILKAGAGGYQVLSGTSSFEFYNSNFDDPVDQKWIQEGINDYNNNFWDAGPSTTGDQSSTQDQGSENFWNSTFE